MQRWNPCRMRIHLGKSVANRYAVFLEHIDDVELSHRFEFDVTLKTRWQAGEIRHWSPPACRPLVVGSQQRSGNPKERSLARLIQSENQPFSMRPMEP